MAGRLDGASKGWEAAGGFGPRLLDRRGTLVAGLLAALLLSFLLARFPLFAGGAAIGGILLFLFVWRPLIMLAALFALGPLDLSFITGGLKALDVGVAGGLDMNGIRLAGVAAGLGLLLIVDPRIRREAFGRYGRFYLLFLAYACLTLAFSPVPFDGLRLLTKLAYPFLIFVTVLGAARDRRDIDRILDWTLVGAAVLTLVVNPFYVAAGGYHVDFEGRTRVQGLGIHENPFSFWLLTMLLISLIRFWSRRQWRYLGLCAAAALWIALTLTRSAMLASTVAFGALGVYAIVVTRNVRAVLPIVVIGAGVLAFFVPAFVERTFHAGMPTIADITEAIRDPMEIAYFMNLSGREVLWAVVIAGFLSSPLTGLGLGGSSALLESTFSAEVGHIAHNEYLRVLADTGMIGGGLFAIALLIWGWGILRALRTPGTRPEYTLPAMAVFLAWAVISLADNTIDYYAAFSQYLGFLCAAAVVTAREAAGSGNGPAGDAATADAAGADAPVADGRGRGGVAGGRP